MHGVQTLFFLRKRSLQSAFNIARKPISYHLNAAHALPSEACSDDFIFGSVPDTGRYNDIKLKILRFSRKGVGCGEGKNLFSREKKDNGADVRPPPRDTIDPCREQRVIF